MKLIEKLNQRETQFGNHPVTKQQQKKALLKYVYFNALGRLRDDLTFNWIGNLKFKASIGDAGIVGNIYFGLAEFEESCFTVHFLRASDRFVDVGANLGHYSLLASGLTDCKSVAIEPIPETVVKLKKQITLNRLQNNISCLNIGLAAKPGELSFTTNKGTMNRIVSPLHPHSVSVKVDTLDNVLMGKEVALIKIDVEGYEKPVLEGGARTLANPSLKALIIELNGSGKKFNVDDKQTFMILKSFGFLPCRYDPATRRLSRIGTYERAKFNTIFVRDIPFVRSRLESGMQLEVWGHCF